MKKPLQLVVSLSALVAYAAIVCAGYFHALAETVNEACERRLLSAESRCIEQKRLKCSYAGEGKAASRVPLAVLLSQLSLRASAAR